MGCYCRFCHTREQVVASDSNAFFSKIVGFVLFVTLNNRNLKFLANIWLFISRHLFTHVALKTCAIFNLISLTCHVDLSMHILMSYFYGIKVQMTTALLLYRNCCSFSHPYGTPWEPWDRSMSFQRCSCRWHSSNQLQASNCTSNQWQKFLSLM